MTGPSGTTRRPGLRPARAPDTDLTDQGGHRGSPEQPDITDPMELAIALGNPETDREQLLARLAHRLGPVRARGLLDEVTEDVRHGEAIEDAQERLGRALTDADAAINETLRQLRRLTDSDGDAWYVEYAEVSKGEDLRRLLEQGGLLIRAAYCVEWPRRPDDGGRPAAPSRRTP